MNVLALPERAADDDDDTLPHVVVKQRAVLPINVSEISRPVAMETGFTVPYSSMMQIRKQVRTSILFLVSLLLNFFHWQSEL